MVLSIVIPSYRDPECLELTLRSLTRQTVPADGFEVVVVRDGPAPGYEPIDSFQRQLDLSVVTLPQRRGRAAARNAGIQRASGATVLFLDSDSYAAPDLVARHRQAHDAGDPRVLIGLRYEIGWPQLGAVLRGESPAADMLDAVECRDLRFPPGGPESARPALRAAPWMFAYTHNVSVSRKLLIATGGFDEEFGTRWGWEDLELFYRVYLELGRDGDAFDLDTATICYHLPHYRDTNAWYQDYRANEARAKQTHPHLDWEFAGRWLPVDAAGKVRYYRHVIADCVAADSCHVPAVWPWLATWLADTPPSRVLWIGTGTEQLPLDDRTMTFDYRRPPSGANLHLIGTAIPASDDTLDAVVNVDFWRCLAWADMCLFLAESLRVAATVWLVCTQTPLAGSPAPTHGELDHLTRVLGRQFGAELVTDDSAGAGWPAAVRLRRKDDRTETVRD